MSSFVVVIVCLISNICYTKTINPSSGSSVNCGSGTASETCQINCNNGGVASINCGTYGTCIIYCTADSCARTITIDATYTQDLILEATAANCIERSQTLLPQNGGSATITIDSNGNTNNQDVARSHEFHSQNTGNISITCKDSSRSYIDTCEAIKIYASDADCEQDGNGNDILIECPTNSAFPDVPCIIDASNSLSTYNMKINAPKGSPQGVLFYGSSSSNNKYDGTTLICDAGSSSIDTNTGSFDGISPCWITLNPTTDPTSDPSNDPTSNPTKYPSIDSILDPTIDPTSDPTNHPTSDPTDDPTTLSPTLPTSNPTQGPTSFGETIAPTNNPSKKPSALKSGRVAPETTTNESRENDVVSIVKTSNFFIALDHWMFVAIISGATLLCLLIGCLIVVKLRQKTRHVHKNNIRNTVSNEDGNQRQTIQKKQMNIVSSTSPISDRMDDGALTGFFKFRQEMVNNVIANDITMDNVVNHMSTQGGESGDVIEMMEDSIANDAMIDDIVHHMNTRKGDDMDMMDDKGEGMNMDDKIDYIDNNENDEDMIEDVNNMNVTAGANDDDDVLDTIGNNQDDIDEYLDTDINPIDVVFTRNESGEFIVKGDDKTTKGNDYGDNIMEDEFIIQGDDDLIHTKYHTKLQ